MRSIMKVIIINNWSTRGTLYCEVILEGSLQNIMSKEQIMDWICQSGAKQRSTLLRDKTLIFLP